MNENLLEKIGEYGCSGVRELIHPIVEEMKDKQKSVEETFLYYVLSLMEADNDTQREAKCVEHLLYENDNHMLAMHFEKSVLDKIKDRQYSLTEKYYTSFMKLLKQEDYFPASELMSYYVEIVASNLSGNRNEFLRNRKLWIPSLENYGKDEYITITDDMYLRFFDILHILVEIYLYGKPGVEKNTRMASYYFCQLYHFAQLDIIKNTGRTSLYSKILSEFRSAGDMTVLDDLKAYCDIADNRSGYLEFAMNLSKEDKESATILLSHYAGKLIVITGFTRCWTSENGVIFKPADSSNIFNIQPRQDAPKGQYAQIIEESNRYFEVLTNAGMLHLQGHGGASKDLKKACEYIYYSLCYAKVDVESAHKKAKVYQELIHLILQEKDDNYWCVTYFLWRMIEELGVKWVPKDISRAVVFHHFFYPIAEFCESCKINVPVQHTYDSFDDKKLDGIGMSNSFERMLRRYAEEGDPTGMLEYGKFELYRRLDGYSSYSHTYQSYHTTEYYFKYIGKLAKAENPEALRWRAFQHMNAGKYNDAYRCYSKAADLGDSVAKKALGYFTKGLIGYTFDKKKQQSSPMCFDDCDWSEKGQERLYQFFRHLCR